MFLFLYRTLVVPLTALALPVLCLGDRKLRRGLRMRLRRRKFPDFAERPVWIHASSGEFEYAKPLIREIKTRFPHLPIVATYFSPTFALTVENFPGVDFALPLPIDLPGPTTTFLKRVNPRVALIARTDFWPEMLYRARARKIPIEVFSYTQKPQAWRWSTRFRASLVDRIHCVSTDDLVALEALDVNCKLEMGGDTRYDQVSFRLAHPKPLPAGLKPNKFCMVAGSTWKEDEAVLLPALLPLLKSGALKLILVPHEPTVGHIAKLRAELRLLGLTYSVYSETSFATDDPVLLVDKVGILAELYAWADIAFVGGSFKQSVHSVMEALGTGALTLVGPKHTNNREAMEFKMIRLEGRAPLIEVTNKDDLREVVEDAIKNRATLKPLSTDIIKEFKSREGATERLLSTLNSILS